MALMNEPTGPSRSRAAWAAGAAAAVLALAGGTWLLDRPADAPPPTADAPAAAAPRAPEQPLQPPTVAQAEAPPVLKPQPAIASASTASAAATPPAQPKPAPQAGDDLRKVQLALQGDASPADTLAAAKTLGGCKGADGAVEAMYRMRDEGGAGWREAEKGAGVRAESVITAMQALQRRCQVFDAATLARRPELLKRAYDGGAKDAALDYLMWLNLESKQPPSPELLAALQRDARQAAEDGDTQALVMYSQPFDPKLGATPVQRQAYKEAWLSIVAETVGPAAAKASRDMMDNLDKTLSQAGMAPPPLNAEQQREASALTERVVGAWRRRQGKGG